MIATPWLLSDRVPEYQRPRLFTGCSFTVGICSPAIVNFCCLCFPFWMVRLLDFLALNFILDQVISSSSRVKTLCIVSTSLVSRVTSFMKAFFGDLTFAFSSWQSADLSSISITPLLFPHGSLQISVASPSPGWTRWQIYKRELLHSFSLKFLYWCGCRDAQRSPDFCSGWLCVEGDCKEIM